MYNPKSVLRQTGTGKDYEMAKMRADMNKTVGQKIIEDIQ